MIGTQREDTCPYCTCQVKEASGDHIFPQFLGGTRKIACCKACNSTFGHTFEAEAAKPLQDLFVLLATHKVPMKSSHASWRRALVRDGMEFDLSVGPAGVKAELSKPVIRKDASGNENEAVFATRKRAEQFARGKNKKGEKVDIETKPAFKSELPKTQLAIDVGIEFQRLALKMCIALATTLPRFQVDEVDQGRQVLMGHPSITPADVIAMYGPDARLDSRRSPLSHAIYVERNEARVYGVIVFYGSIRLYCHLGSPVENAPQCARLAVLSPVGNQGKERIEGAPILGLEEPQLGLDANGHAKFIAEWPKLDKAREQRFDEEIRMVQSGLSSDE